MKIPVSCAYTRSLVDKWVRGSAQARSWGHKGHLMVVPELSGIFLEIRPWELVHSLTLDANKALHFLKTPYSKSLVKKKI